jgi:predicted ATPase
MQITQLKVQNYKSLRSITLEPSDLTVLVGANGSGKSNLADCIDFISEIYNHGLEMAVARKGGYDNIAHHKKQRSRRAVSVDVTSVYEWRYPMPRQAKPLFHVKCRHQFDFVTKGSSIRAEFRVIRERLDVSIMIDNKWVDLIHVERRAVDKYDARRPDKFTMRLAPNELLETLFPKQSPELREVYLGYQAIKAIAAERQVLPSTELLMTTVGMPRGVFLGFAQAMRRIKVFQLSPTSSRQFGVPTPNPELDRTGANLPAVIDLIQKRFEEDWGKILQIMRGILPDLVDIEVGYNTSRTLSLFFQEAGAGRAWNTDEISDGTIQTLAILVAIFDPRSSALVIEEPENSVHPWVIRNVLEACVSASRTKQILITTHSPIVVNYVKPDHVWVIWRGGGESKLARLTDLDPSFLEMWQAGKVSTFDFLDSGGVTEAVPPSPIVD